jgi:DNA-directed RNA polymerase subunit RPC12/RpoP
VPVVCPHCNSKYIHRSKRRGIFELSVLSLVPIRPFRCEDCDRRFYWFAWAGNSIQADAGSSR